MSIQDLLRPDQRAALKRLRKRIANREHMRRRRAADPLYYRRLCAGVDLPLEAGTCGRHVNRSSGERCYRCWQRRRWLLNHAMTPYEIAVTGTLADDLERDVADGEREDDLHTGAIVPLLDAVDDMLAPADDPCLRW
ncbi:MAG: hypothetical protein OXH75_29200 [Acidobacteria bacterium]|nr:hypothetical protein [Acidobacteriota bacterium]